MMNRLSLWWPAALLGLATIGAYGTAYYAIGVLLPVIAAETGWRGSLLSGGFSLGVLGQGAVALWCGHTFDRRGSGTAVTGSRMVYLEDLGVRPGDFVAYYARARATIRTSS